MNIIDKTGASEQEFRARIAPFEADDADVQRELAEALWQAHWNDYGSNVRAARDAAVLLPTVQALIADAEKRAAARALEPFRELFAGGPDTSCRTTWVPDESVPAWCAVSIECVEVPMADLRAAFDRAESLP